MEKKEKLYFFANWKMYLDEEVSRELAGTWAREETADGVRTVIFPSALALPGVREAIKGSAVGLGAQNAYWVDKGGYTGEVSVEMFKKSGCEYILVGHSERRYIFGETDEDVRKKMEVIIENGLVPVLCVGETAREREAGKTEEVVEIQLRATLADLDMSAAREKKIIVAYEPVWAIGTGVDCSAGDAAPIHKKIAELGRALQPGVEFVFLYGGSVNEENIVSHVADPFVDGVLVGTASTKPEKAAGIVRAMRDFLLN